MTYKTFITNVLLFFLFVTGTLSCSKTDIDEQKPEVDLKAEGAHPLNCELLYFSDTINLHYLLTDNMELGSWSVDIHNNFDHHSHSTEVESCDLLPVKTPVNPFLHIEYGEIPAGLVSYELDKQIFIPVSSSAGNFDEGDYHLTIRLTDRVGWSVQKGISIKIMHKE